MIISSYQNERMINLDKVRSIEFQEEMHTPTGVILANFNENEYLSLFAGDTEDCLKIMREFYNAVKRGDAAFEFEIKS